MVKTQVVSNMLSGGGGQQKQRTGSRGAVQGPSQAGALSPIRRYRGQVMQDSYDYILNHFVNEGYDEKDVIQAMSSLTEEPVSLALIGAKLLGGAKAAATAIKGSKFAATAGKALGKVRKIADSPVVQNFALSKMGDRAPEERSGGRSSAPVAQYSSTDLFDIVKGQLLDEGLSEEEIKDIMLELTPEEILAEMDTNYPAGKGANYQEKPKVPEKKKLGGRTDGTAGSYVEKPQPKPQPKPNM